MNKEEGQYQGDENGWKINDTAVSWHQSQSFGKGNSSGLEKSHHIAGPSRGHGAGGNGVLKYEIPSYDKGDELSKRCVGIGVGTA